VDVHRAVYFRVHFLLTSSQVMRTLGWLMAVGPLGRKTPPPSPAQLSTLPALLLCMLYNHLGRIDGPDSPLLQEKQRSVSPSFCFSPKRWRQDVISSIHGRKESGPGPLHHAHTS
jgi:hypothetical protein